MINTDAFRFRLDPGLAPILTASGILGFDTRRFDVAFWQRVEKALAYAREKDVIFDIIFFLDGQDPGVDPFGKGGMGSPDEQLYYQIRGRPAVGVLQHDVGHHQRMVQLPYGGLG